MPASNRPEKIAATPVVGDDEALLARWNRTFLTVQGSDSDKCRDLARIGDALATRLRAALADVARVREELVVEQRRVHDHSENAAPAVGEDEALLNVLDAAASHFIRTQDYELAQGVQAAAVHLRAALADVARVRVQRDLQRTAIQAQEERHSAALAAAEQEKEKAVAEERDWWLKEIRIIKRSWPNHAMPILELEAQYRARAGRNDG